jgi:uncharacterized SAM-binding protein YcdF (DUF218 family)
MIDFNFKQERLLKWLIVLAAAAVLLVIGVPAAMNGAAQALIRTDAPAKSDVIVALAGDPRSHREKHAAALHQQGWAKHVVVGGVQASWGIHTAEAAKRYVVSLGVPESNVWMIRDTWNTRQEAKQLERLMRANQWRSAIVVTSAFHSRRATYTIERAAPDFAFRSAPVPMAPPEWQPDGWWSRRVDLGVTVREFVSWANTLVGGWE